MLKLLNRCSNSSVYWTGRFVNSVVIVAPFNQGTNLIILDSFFNTIIFQWNEIIKLSHLALFEVSFFFQNIAKIHVNDHVYFSNILNFHSYPLLPHHHNPIFHQWEGGNSLQTASSRQCQSYKYSQVTEKAFKLYSTKKTTESERSSILGVLSPSTELLCHLEHGGQ